MLRFGDYFTRRHSEQIPSEPFVIRGHHLKIFSELLNTGSTARQFAATLRGGFARSRRRMQWDPELYAAELDYYRDYMGDSYLAVRKTEIRSREVYRKFLELPERHPLEVVTAMADTLCGVCVIGNHCSSRNSVLYGDDYVEYDGRAAAKFRTVAEQLNLGDDLTTIVKKAEFSNSPPVEVECILTTCGTARVVLSTGLLAQK